MDEIFMVQEKIDKQNRYTKQQKKKYAKFKDSIIKANADHIDNLEKQISDYNNKLKQLKQHLHLTHEQLREQMASLWKLEDTIDDDSNDSTNDDTCTMYVSTNGELHTVNGLDKINDKSYTTNVKHGCIHIRDCGATATGISEIIKIV